MAITKPYTFQAGTKARASEVNQDFDILYSEVNRIGTEIVNIDIDIQNIDESKADINGNAGQVFKMANAVDSYDGVNKNVLENSIANIKDYISGFTISKDTDTSIIVSSGSCYDSTYTVVINSTGNITKENTIQGAGTRYVHAISDNTGRQVDILISSQSIDPALPSGYTKYRNIGSYITDNNGNITTIYYYGVEHNKPSATSVVIKTYINGTSGYRLWSNGWKEQWGTYTATSDNTGPVSLLLNYSNANYFVTAQFTGSYGRERGDYNYSQEGPAITARTESSFNVATWRGWNGIWYACGY